MSGDVRLPGQQACASASGVARPELNRYRVQLFQAVPGTNTRWTKLTDLFFDSPEPFLNVQSAVLELRDEFIAFDEPEPETGPPGTQMTPDPAHKLPSDGPVAELQGFSWVRGGMIWPC